MAEIIGLIGSIVALNELAGKISACILALKNLLNEIKDVSSKLSAIMREIEILEPIVEGMSREFNDGNNILANWNDATVLLSIEYCEKALGDLTSVLGDLVQETNTPKKLKRYKAAMKTIIKKDVLERCHTRLQSAVRFLSLTQQWYIIALLKAQPVLVVEHLFQQGFVPRSERNLNTSARMVPETVITLPRHTQGTKPLFSGTVVPEEWGTPRHTSSWKFGPLGSICWGYYKNEEKLFGRKFSFISRLQANYWFARRVWDIQVSRAIIGWNIKLNTYCIQPDSASVFTYARNGDIDGLLRLIDLGEASLQDHTPSGQNLIHLAAEYGHLDLAKVLVTRGLDLFELDDTRSANPCELFILFGLRHRVDVARLHQFFVDNDMYVDGGLFIGPNTTVYFFECMRYGSPEDLNTLIPACFPRFHKLLALEERIGYYSFDNPDGHPGTFRFLMNADRRVSREDILSLQQKQISLLPLLAFHYGAMSIRRTSYSTRLWRQLAREVIQMTEDLSFQGFGFDPTFQSREFINKGMKFNPVLRFLRDIQPLTALFAALSYFCYEAEEAEIATCARDLKRRMKTTLTWWLEDLAACQVNLMEYGRREKRIFLRSEEIKRAWYHCGDRIEHTLSSKYTFEDTVRLVNFEYGARPSDWQFHWDMETERYAGDFWRSFENLPPHR
ncbi:hypothetical protein GGR58DRAFT_65952 [Xylaria digitata]|nr:hypothetical protein GGR58DRAFT_65952 [Xylaria digitata]